MLRILIDSFIKFLTETSVYASTNGRTASFYATNIILLIALIVIFIPYLIPLALKRFNGIYITDWDNNLGSCFGGSLGGGYGMFSGNAKKYLGGKW